MFHFHSHWGRFVQMYGSRTLGSVSDDIPWPPFYIINRSLTHWVDLELTKIPVGFFLPHLEFGCQNWKPPFVVKCHILSSLALEKAKQGSMQRMLSKNKTHYRRWTQAHSQHTPWTYHRFSVATSRGRASCFLLGQRCWVKYWGYMVHFRGMIQTESYENYLLFQCIWVFYLYQAWNNF